MFQTRILRIDPRDEEPTVEQINTYLPKVKMAIRTQLYQDQYRINCLNGHAHPLRIEEDAYHLTMVHRMKVDRMIDSETRSWFYQSTFSQREVEFIKQVKSRPEVAWAIDNSFDGIYIMREEAVAEFCSIYKFAVYLKEEHETFWRLKFNGR